MALRGNQHCQHSVVSRTVRQYVTVDSVVVLCCGRAHETNIVGHKSLPEEITLGNNTEHWRMIYQSIYRQRKQHVQRSCNRRKPMWLILCHIDYHYFSHFFICFSIGSNIKSFFIVFVLVLVVESFPHFKMMSLHLYSFVLPWFILPLEIYLAA